MVRVREGFRPFKETVFQFVLSNTSHPPLSLAQRPGNEKRTLEIHLASVDDETESRWRGMNKRAP